MKRYASLAAALLLGWFGGLSAQGQPVRLVPLTTAAGDAWPAPWRLVVLPDNKAPATRFSQVTLEGHRVARVAAEASYGNLVHELPGSPGERRLTWRWRLDEQNTAVDLRRKRGDDTAIKVCALFDLPIGKVPFVERQLLRVARMISRENLPAATVCYVWDPRLPQDTVLDNAYTRRVRIMVLRGTEAPLLAWQTEVRDLAADFRQLFGDESAEVPPLRAVLVGADADNTHGRSVAHLGAISLD
jgi:Protein of unknown function (DUF3047)